MELLGTNNNPWLEPVHSRLSAGAVLVTSTRRLARYAAESYGRWRMAQGVRVWESPQIHTWGAWLRELWMDLSMRALSRGDRPLSLLSGHQSLALWEEIVSEWNTRHELLLPAALAQHAQEAWDLLRDWRVDLPKTGLSEECLAFRVWAQEYARRCARQHWTDEASLLALLAASISSGELPVLAEVWLAGFDELSPAQINLVETIRAYGGAVEVAAQSPVPAGVCTLGLADAQTEAQAVARWARVILENNQQNHNIIIGIVAPDLSQRRDQIERSLREVLTPGAVASASDEPSRLFNISLGLVLAGLPLVHTGLQLLELRLARLSLLEIGDLLTSPFWAAAEQEQASRARLDLRLREAGMPQLSAAALAEAAGVDGAAHCPTLAQALNAALAQEVPDLGKPSLWAKAFADWLLALGWPGERALSSAEFQTVQAWHEVLVEFAALDTVLPALRPKAALNRLKALAGARLFQPESPAAPVQVMGMLEAADLRFDHLWVLGLDDTAWPRAVNPNPLIPIEFQRKHRLPRSGAERELQFARRLTERLLSSADTVVLSYPLTDGERALRPSALLDEVPRVSLDQLPQAQLPGPYAWPPLASPLETYADEQGPGLANDHAMRGGSRLVEDQAACPFRAFARHRLGATSPADPETGLNALIRGNLVHETLHAIWGELGSLDKLLASPPDSSRALVSRAAKGAVARQQRRRPDLWGPRRSRIETERLSALILEWLACERERQPFTVLGCELPRELRLGPLQLRLRIDRADRLADGKVALIDYKTARQLKPGDWDTERPAAPQLPLYALTEPENLGAVLYAKLRKGGSGFLGRAEDNTQLFDNIEYSKRIETSPDWPAQLESWRETMARLAGEFSAGHAAVDPQPYACARCDLHPLCRIHSLATAAGGPDQEASDGE